MAKVHLNKNSFFTFILFLFISVAVDYIYAQSPEDERIENISSVFSGNDVIIKYDLTGLTDKDYFINIELKRKSNSSYSYRPKRITGDCGKGIIPGKGKQIIWDISKEFENGLFGNDYFFEVKIENSKLGVGKILWIGAGVAVLGGGIAYLLFLKDKSSTSVDFPPPPIRP